MYNYACICYIVVKEKKHITHKEVLTKLEAEFNEARYHNITISCSESYWDKIGWNWIFHNLFKTKTDLKAKKNSHVMIQSSCLTFDDNNSFEILDNTFTHYYNIIGIGSKSDTKWYLCIKNFWDSRTIHGT